MKTEQVEMVSVEQLVPEKHTYRRLKTLLDFDRIAKSVKLPIKGLLKNGQKSHESRVDAR